MASTLRRYLERVVGAVNDEDGPAAGALLRLEGGAELDGALRALPRGGAGVAGFVAQQLGHGPWAEVVAAHLEARAELARDNAASAYSRQEACFSTFMRLYTGRDDDHGEPGERWLGNWAIPVLEVIWSDLRLVALRADRQRNTLNQDDGYTRTVSNLLQNAWKSVKDDRTDVADPEARRRAVFVATVVVFKHYFLLNTLHLCESFITFLERNDRATDQPDPSSFIAQYHLFPRASVVAYQYYVGRLRMFQDKYASAQRRLQFALRHLPPGREQERNRCRILRLLIPVNLLMGRFPTDRCLQQAKAPALAEIAAAVRQGNVERFNAAVSTHQSFLLRQGLFVTVERAKSTVYRTLLRKMYRVLGEKIWLGHVERVLRWQGEELDLDDVECVLANLIYNGKVKGYISHAKRTLVALKGDVNRAFPPV